MGATYQDVEVAVTSRCTMFTLTCFALPPWTCTCQRVSNAIPLLQNSAAVRVDQESWAATVVTTFSQERNLIHQTRYSVVVLFDKQFSLIVASVETCAFPLAKLKI